MMTALQRKRYASERNEKRIIASTSCRVSVVGASSIRLDEWGNLPVYASRINSLSCLFYIDLESFFAVQLSIRERIIIKKQ